MQLHTFMTYITVHRVIVNVWVHHAQILRTLQRAINNNRSLALVPNLLSQVSAGPCPGGVW